MSNLGMYQVATTLFKRFGGPVKFFALYGGVCTALGIGITKGIEMISKAQNDKNRAAEAAKIHIVTKDGTSNEGLAFTVGEKFRVLERDGDAVLIEKLEDSNNPYFVSAKFLSSISDYDLT